MSGEAAAPRKVRRRPWYAQDWYFAVALALFVGTLVWFSRSIQDFVAPAARTVAAPTLVGQTTTDALSTASRMKLRAVVVQRVASDRYPKDVVMRQDPVPGEQVREGRQISIVVSNGLQIFPMPDLRYETLREVGLDLSHYKLTLGKIRYVQNDEVPANRVVAQVPPPLSSARVGTVVNVDLSKGFLSNVKVPELIGMTVEEARDRITASHLHVGQIVWTPFGRYGPPRGEVVRQNPGSGTSADPSQLVSLQVSAGPRESGYLIRQVHATATVPESNDIGIDADSGKTDDVRVEVRDETGTWNVYNAYAQPRQKLDFNLTVVGTAELELYVNNELLSSTRLGVEPAVQEKQQLGAPPQGSKVPTDRLNPTATQPPVSASPAAGADSKSPKPR